MYEKWVIKKWDTEIYDKVLDFVSLTDSDRLIIVVESIRESGVQYSIEFTGRCSYRNVDEGYRNNLWAYISEKKIDDARGFTWIVENSDFLDFLRDDPNFNGMCEEAVQFVICTVNSVVEVVTDVAPIIKKINE